MRITQTAMPQGIKFVHSDFSQSTIHNLRKGIQCKKSTNSKRTYWIGRQLVTALTNAHQKNRQIRVTWYNKWNINIKPQIAYLNNFIYSMKLKSKPLLYCYCYYTGCQFPIPSFTPVASLSVCRNRLNSYIFRRFLNPTFIIHVVPAQWCLTFRTLVLFTYLLAELSYVRLQTDGQCQPPYAWLPSVSSCVADGDVCCFSTRIGFPRHVSDMHLCAAATLFPAFAVIVHGSLPVTSQCSLLGPMFLSLRSFWIAHGSPRLSGDNREGASSRVV